MSSYFLFILSCFFFLLLYETITMTVLAVSFFSFSFFFIIRVKTTDTNFINSDFTPARSFFLLLFLHPFFNVILKRIYVFNFVRFRLSSGPPTIVPSAFRPSSPPPLTKRFLYLFLFVSLPRSVSLAVSLLRIYTFFFLFFFIFIVQLVYARLNGSD